MKPISKPFVLVLLLVTLFLAAWGQGKPGSTLGPPPPQNPCNTPPGVAPPPNCPPPQNPCPPTAVGVPPANCPPQKPPGGPPTPTPPPTVPPIGQIPPQVPAPAILRLVPNQVPVGSENVEITLQGRNFQPGAMVQFGGAGIFVVSGVQFLDDTQISVTINVLATALTGGRDVTVTNPGGLSGLGKGMLNLTGAAPTKAKPAPSKGKGPKFATIGPMTSLQKGKIYLTDPLWGLVNQSGEIQQDKGVPLMDDDIVFKWKEQNPGTADYFELRIYAKDGKTLLMTQRINANSFEFGGKLFKVVPTYFRPDADFIQKVTEKVPAPGKYAYAKMPGGKSAKTETTGTKLEDGSMQWEVAGFRSYPKSGVEDDKSKGDTVDIEVEISDRWPLGKPDLANGLDCSSETQKGSLNVVINADKNIYDKSGKKIGEDPNNYPGDEFTLTGDFGLANSPYRTNPDDLKNPPAKDDVFVTVKQFTFDNVFVDWGDGSTPERITAYPTSSAFSWSRGQKVTLPGLNDPSRTGHAYGWTGTFTVRVFQIAEADLQKVSAASAVAAVDGTSVSPYAKLVSLGMSSASPGTSSSKGVALGATARLTGPRPGDVAGRAYLLYCHKVVVTERKDPDATGPLHLVSIQITDFPGHGKPLDSSAPTGPKREAAVSAAPKAPSAAPAAASASAPGGVSSGKMASSAAMAAGGAALPPGPPTASTCDESLQGKAVLKYYGKGTARITWRLDGTVVGSPEEVKGLSSEPRHNLGSDKSKWPPPVVSSAEVTSPYLSCKVLGQHSVTAEAEVVPEPKAPDLMASFSTVINAAVAPKASAPNTAVAGSVLKGLSTTKVGVLSPSSSPTSGPMVAYLSPSVGGLLITAITGPPLDVVSKPAVYEVKQSDPEQPCTFIFSTKGGDFRVTDLQGHITKTGTQYSGNGVLQLSLTDGPDSAHPYAVPVNFANWEVPDGSKVKNGSLAVSPGEEVMAPGLKGKLDKVAGQVEPSQLHDMLATFDLTLKDQTLRLASTSSPPQWSNAQAPITSDGNWYLDKQKLPRILIGWSMFQIESADARFDLDRSQGDPAGSLCSSGSGAKWVGVHLGGAKLIPYTMDLVGAGSLDTPVTDWAVVDGGLCGSVTTGPFNTKLDEGTLHFDSLQAKAQNGTFSALYKNMKVHVPWLEADLTGDAKLQSSGGDNPDYISFPLTGSISPKDYGNFVMKPGSPSFGREKGVGWSVQTNTHFDFKAEGKPFASFDSNGLFFGMNGRAYFKGGATGQDVGLSGKSSLGDSPLDLVSVHLEAPVSGAPRLQFAIHTTVNISEVLPSAPMQVNYAINKPSATYVGDGPTNSPFQVEVDFPLAQPTVHEAINPVYGHGSGTRYSGVVDMAMFGGPPVTAEFLLGYQGGHDFWITRATIGLGSTGVTLVPGIMNLYKIRGGLGHNFPLDSFKSLSPITGLTPVMDSSFVFMAGMRVGSPDQFAYTLDGDLSVKITGIDPGARMDFHAWIMDKEHSGEGTFQGFFQYTPGNFDGQMWGKLALLEGAASIEVPKGSTELHFGGGHWHVYLGRKEGPRIKGTLLFISADSYAMVGDEVGLAVGGSEHVYLGVGDSSVASAYIKGYMDMGVQVTPQPHFIGDFGAGCEAGVCAFDVCVSAGVSAQIHAEALPVDLSGNATLELPWPLPDVSFHVHL